MAHEQPEASVKFLKAASFVGGLFAWAVMMLGVVSLVALPLASAHTGTPALPTFSSGQTLTYTDLNNAFAHLHNTFTAGIKDEHIKIDAAIQHTKLLSPGLIPKAWALATASCTTATCTLAASQRVSSVTRSAAGTYTVTLAYTAADTTYGLVGTPLFTGFIEFDPPASTTTIRFGTYNTAGVATDNGFMVVIYDDTN